MACVGKPTQTLFSYPTLVTESVSNSYSYLVYPGPSVSTTHYFCEPIEAGRRRQLAYIYGRQAPICQEGYYTSSSVEVIDGTSQTSTYTFPEEVEVTESLDPVAYSTLYGPCMITTTTTTTTPRPTITPSSTTTPSTTPVRTTTSQPSIVIIPTTQPATTRASPSPIPTPTMTPIPDTSGGRHHNTGIIAGAVVVGLVVLGVVGLACYYFWNKYHGHHVSDEDLFGHHGEGHTPSSNVKTYLDAPHGGHGAHTPGNPFNGQNPPPNTTHGFNAPYNAYGPNAPPNIPNEPPNAFGPNAPQGFIQSNPPPSLPYANPTALASYAAAGGAGIAGTTLAGYASGELSPTLSSVSGGANVLRRPNSGGHDDAQNPEVYYPTPYVQPEQQPMDYYDPANEKRRFAQGEPPSFDAVLEAQRRESRGDSESQGPYAGGSYY